MSYATVYLYGGEAKGLHSGERLLFAVDTGKGLYLSLYNPWNLRRYRMRRVLWEKLVNDSLEKYGYEKVFRRPSRDAIERSLRGSKREIIAGVAEGMLRQAGAEQTNLNGLVESPVADGVRGVVQRQRKAIRKTQVQHHTKRPQSGASHTSRRK